MTDDDEREFIITVYFLILEKKYSYFLYPEA